jgi:hypothetical protein
MELIVETADIMYFENFTDEEIEWIFGCQEYTEEDLEYKEIFIINKDWLSGYLEYIQCECSETQLCCEDVIKLFQKILYYSQNKILIFKK